MENEFLFDKNQIKIKNKYMTKREKAVQLFKFFIVKTVDSKNQK